MNELSITKRAIDQFRELFATGIEKIHDAAKVYVEAIDADEEAANEFKAAFPGIPHGAWAGFEAVGRGWLDRRLLWGGGNAAGALKRLPLSQQSKSLDRGVEVLAADGSALLVKVEDMTNAQIKQAFASDHLRNLSEQRAWLESKRQKDTEPPSVEMPYEVRKGRLVVNEPTTFTRQDIARILWEIER